MPSLPHAQSAPGGCGDGGGSGGDGGGSGGEGGSGGKDGSHGQTRRKFHLEAAHEKAVEEVWE